MTLDVLDLQNAYLSLRIVLDPTAEGVTGPDVGEGLQRFVH